VRLRDALRRPPLGARVRLRARPARAPAGGARPCRRLPLADATWLACLLLLLYTYVGYPVLLALAVAIAAACHRRARPRAPGPLPPAAHVSIVVPAHDEAAVIAAKLQNCLERARAELAAAELIVVSDGSTDGTDALVAARAADGVRLVRLTRRSGKAAALNAGIRAAGGEWLVLTDANTLLAPGALRALLAPFADPRVGAVAGAKRILAAASVASAPERWYWRYEDLLKRLESRLGVAAGADGALMAIRRAAWRDLRDDRAGQDFYPSLRVLLDGQRLVYAPAAVAWEQAAPTLAQELERKDRTLGSGLVSLWRLRALLGPRHPRAAWVLVSHRLLRFAVAPALLGLLLGSLRGARRPARLLALAQLAAYLAAAFAWGSLRRGRRPPTLALAPYYFLALHLRALRAIGWALRPRGADLWPRVPRALPDPPPGDPGGPTTPAARAAPP